MEAPLGPTPKPLARILRGEGGNMIELKGEGCFKRHLKKYVITIITAQYRRSRGTARTGLHRKGRHEQTCGHCKMQERTKMGQRWAEIKSREANTGQHGGQKGLEGAIEGQTSKHVAIARSKKRTKIKMEQRWAKRGVKMDSRSAKMGQHGAKKGRKESQKCGRARQILEFVQLFFLNRC